MHPFTTVTHLASESSTTHPDEYEFPIQFLFRKQGKAPHLNDATITPLPILQRIFRGKKQRVQSTQWTARLAALVDEHHSSSPKQQSDPDIDMEKSAVMFNPEEIRIDVALRLEGPYFSPADPSRYNTVVCLVAGTGVSGAIAIAAAFNYAARNDTANIPARKWRRCTLLWSVKELDEIELPFIEPKAEGLELRKYLTGPNRTRVNLTQVLTEICVKGSREGERSWVYISGPNKYIDSAKQACKEVMQQTELEFYAASWDI